MGLSAVGALIAIALAFLAQSPRLLTRLNMAGQRLDMRARTLTGYGLALLLLMASVVTCEMRDAMNATINDDKGSELRSWIGRSETVHDSIGPTPVIALTATLDQPAAAVPAGTPLPPLWHWLYFLPQALQLPGDLTPSDLCHDPAALGRFGIEPAVASMPMSSLSAGQHRRVGLAQVWAARPDLMTAYTFQPETAAALLDTAGWAFGDGMRFREGAPLTLRLVALDQPEQRAVAEAVAQQWAALGVDAQLTLLPDLPALNAALLWTTVASTLAIRVAGSICRDAPVHAAGYCIGGTALSALMAWLNREPCEPGKPFPVVDWTLFSTLVDFSEPGDIGFLVTRKSVEWIEAMMKDGDSQSVI